MAIEILSEHSNDAPVSTELLIATVERNRDRVRTSAGMLMTLAGIAVSACLGMILFLVKAGPGPTIAIGLLAAAAGVLVVAASYAVGSSFLRSTRVISSESQFVADILDVYYRELRFLRVAASLALFGLILMCCGVFAFLFQTSTGGM